MLNPEQYKNIMRSRHLKGPQPCFIESHPHLIMCAYKKGENRQVLEEWFRDNAPHNFLSFRNIYALSPFGMESGARSQGGYYRQQYKCALLIGSPEPFLITLPMFLHASQASLGIEIIIDTPISA